MKRLTPTKLTILIILLSFAISIYSLITYIKPFLPYKNYLLGIDRPTTYTILLQNDTEMRANGGFAGSYAKVTINTQGTKPNIDLSFQDIYVPNGQLNGFVKPPEPIQRAFFHGTWELANADWEPDFPTAATSIRWFLEKGKENNPDILATLNLTTIKKIIDIIGPFTVREYQAEITPTNLYSFLQSQAETNFFPGSTQKKDALTAVGTALKKKFLTLNPLQYFQIARLLKYDLDHGNLLLNATNTDFQNFLLERKWAGKITPGAFDTYLLIEANLGANKANCCIQRHTQHTIFEENSTYRHRVHLELNNTSSAHTPNPPFDFSGHYVSYLRFYIPSDAWNVEILPSQSSPSAAPYIPEQNITTTKNYNLTEIGFFHTTAAGTTSTVDLSYYLATGSASTPYSLTILKQNGLTTSPQSILYQGKTISHLLDSSFTVSY